MGILKRKSCHLYRINGMQDHHNKESFADEFRKLLFNEGIKIDELYFLK